MIRILLISLCTFILAACAHRSASRPPAYSTIETGMLSRTLTLTTSKTSTSTPTTHRFAISVPPNYTPTKPMPAILFLHGKGECGTDGLRQTQQGLGAAVASHPADWPFIIIFPQKPEQQFEWECYPGLAVGTLDAARAEFNIDPARIYLSGLSQGGHGTWVLASQNPDLFAAIAPVCGYGPPRYTPNPAVNTSNDALAARVKHLPIWAFHGLKDDVVPPDRTSTLIDAIKSKQTAADPAPKLTLYPDANHNSWDNAYRNERLGEWLLLHRR